jgi:hypothetical protein
MAESGNGDLAPSSDPLPQCDEGRQVAGVDATRWMLGLAASQIDEALHEGDASIDALTGSITELMETVRCIDEHAEISFEISGLPEDSPLHRFDGRIVDYVQNVVMALQFYDRLSQRMRHVVEGLEGLGGLTGAPERFNQAGAWQQLLDDVCARHSTREERQLFDRLLSDAPLVYVAKDTPDGDDDIELF